jgi:hypothetical protein
MPFTTAQRLQQLGVADALALEIQRQITAGTGNFSRLQEVGLTGGAAKHFATNLAGKTVSATKLVEFAVVPRVARLIASAANA